LQATSRIHTTIRMTVVTVFIFATLLTAGIAIGLQYYFSQSMARNAAADLYTATAQGIASELHGIAEVNTNVINLLAENPELAHTDREAAQLKIFTQVLERNPLFYGMYVGDRDRSFFEVIHLETSETARSKLQATAGDKWVILSVQPTETGLLRRYQYLDKALRQRTSREEITDFDVTGRPWFSSAYASGEVEFSPPYLFSLLDIPGRTVSKRIAGSDTVVGMDMTLASISQFLANNKVASDSSLYLFNKEGLIIASSEAHKQSQQDQQVSRVSLAPEERPLVELARQPTEHGKLHSINLKGEPHVMYVTPSGSGERNLFVGIVTPVDTLLAPFLGKIKLSVVITAGLLFLLLPLSWLFANPIVNPVRQLAAENDKVRRREFSAVQRIPSRVQELDELSDSMVSMVQSIQAHEEAQRELMDSFIRLIAQAIDDKSAYTGGHCERVPELAMMLARHASDSDAPAFSEFSLDTEDQWREYRIAAWLHDCGKITTPEHIVDKGSKLETIYNRIHEVRMRFEVLWRDADVAYWEQLATHPDQQVRLAAQRNNLQCKLQEDYQFVAQCNVGGEFLDEGSLARLKQIAGKTWTRHFDDRIGLSPIEELRLKGDGTPAPATESLLADKSEHIIERTRATDYDPKLGINMEVPVHLYNQGELYNLSIARGTLTDEDRFKINEHMISTIRMLESLPFPDELKNVPRYASTHHETMKGSGYPRRLPGEALSIPERILAIADIFEALTAVDRPYKKAKPVSEAIDILHKMADDNHIDRDCFELFLKERVYMEYAAQYLAIEQIDEVDISRYIDP
jgi:HD-GYP domain-containing protein (c-di-GMP phosphodiesterase class II)